MNKTKQGNNKLSMFVLMMFFVFFSPQMIFGITWTYYDINNKAMNNPTQEEIDDLAKMRVSDTQITQYALEIKHDFSKTWGTGYLENIGNPTPAIGKTWVNQDEKVTCAVDGIVQNVYNMNSRYVATGYYAEGPPNSRGVSHAIQFDGVDDYIKIDELNKPKDMVPFHPEKIEISFSAKRDRADQYEQIIFIDETGAFNYPCRFKIAFDHKKLVFNILFRDYGSSSGTVSVDTLTESHDWKIVYQKGKYPAKNITWYEKLILGCKITIYRDGKNVYSNKFWGIERGACSDNGCWSRDDDFSLYFSSWATKIFVGGQETGKFFKGQMKDLEILMDGKPFGHWEMLDGNQSEIITDSSGNNIHAKLMNFDKTSCWIVNPKLTKRYSFETINPVQHIPDFLMAGPSKIKYDWGTQYAVSVNTLPESMGHLPRLEILTGSGEIMTDSDKTGYTGTGKYWLNHGAQIKFSSKEDQCLQLSGYRDNFQNPNQTIRSDNFTIKTIESSQNISWEYSSYIFEEQVTLGNPISLNTIPPDIRKLIDLSKKPRYISQHVLEDSMMYWHAAEERLFPLRGGDVFDLEYDLSSSSCKNEKVIVRVQTQWPKSPHIVHIAKSPPVNLDPFPNDNLVFKGLKQTNCNAIVNDDTFESNQKGKSVLFFTRNYIKDSAPKDISLNFQGDGHVDLGDISLGKAFTIEFWSKRSDTQGRQIAIGQGNPDYGKGLSIGFDSDNKAFFSIYGQSLTTTTKYTDTDWHHWAWVYETDVTNAKNTENLKCVNDPSSSDCNWKNSRCFTKNFDSGHYFSNNQRYWQSDYYANRSCGEDIQFKLKIYRDGSLVDEKTIPYSYESHGALILGSYGSGWKESTGSYHGQLDDIRIWNVARTQADIQTKMTVRLNGNEADLMAYFPVDNIGLSYVENVKTNATVIRYGTLVGLDPAKSWVNTSDKSYELKTEKISSTGRPCVRLVETRLQTDNKQFSTAFVGHEITAPDYHESAVPHNGFVYWPKVPYNANIYDRSTLKGPIYPVNIKHPGQDAKDTILVIWYRVQDTISWPYQSIEYTCKWPTESDVDLKRIVIASRMGTDGKDDSGKNQTYLDINNSAQNYLDPARYQEIQIYNQPKLSLPGFNPNEEHATVTSSFRHVQATPCPKAVFALRNDLNHTNSEDDSYTSHPYVLIQYFDTVLKKHAMIPFQVETDDPACAYTFDYDMKAGDPLVAPFPLNEAIGATPPPEIFGKNSSPDQNCYWKDHKGQSWAISGSGQTIEIASANLFKTHDDHVEYEITLASHTMVHNHRYLIKVIDDRGLLGRMIFKVSQTDSEKVNASVFVDGNDIAPTDDKTFTVKIRPGHKQLSKNHFKVFHFNTQARIVAYYWYPLQPAFWLDSDTPGDSTGNVGVSIPWLPNGTVSSQDGFPSEMVNKPKAVPVTYDVSWPENVPTLKAGESLTFPGGENRADNSTAPGLPGTLGWSAGQVVYDPLNPKMESNKLYEKYLVRLVPALISREVDLAIDKFPESLKPASKRVDVIMNRWYFKELHAGLKQRIYYDHITQKLGFRGFINDKTIGDSTLTASPPSVYVLQPNILTDRELETIKNIEGADNNFKAAVDQLYAMTRNPNQLNTSNYASGLTLWKKTIDDMTSKHPKKSRYLTDMFYAWLGTHIASDANWVMPEISFGPGLALVPNGGLLDPNDASFSNFSEGYITLAENNHPDMGALPVSLHVIKVVKEKYRGAIKTLYSDNVFDEKITLRHTGDFGANPNDLIFQWWYREQDGNNQATPDISPDKWLAFPDFSGKNGLGMSEISLSGAGAVLLVDNLFYARYRHKDSDPDKPASWSNWAGAANSSPGNYQAQLAEGWTKRVLNAVNPFEARIKSFSNSDSPATYVSMISQAGQRYEGPVAFNPQKDVIENVGLIELYHTVLKRTMDLSINLDQPANTSAVITSLMLAATRIAEFYILLGNEAYNDALDPTIGFGSDNKEYDSQAPTIFTFMNQVPSLLDEEMILLRGRDEKGARPAYNRFLWNFTSGQGEAAYALSYYITDKNRDGFINEVDGRILYPQGHGDAWGHYLTALKGYYDLLTHPNFVWEARAEKVNLEGVVIDVDYFDERNFAKAAAAKARVGREVVDLTYRAHYVEDPSGQYQGYKDTEPDREWGVAGWCRRGFNGAYFDWLVANAILPSEDTENNGIKKIDRDTVMDILEIASQGREIQNHYNNANMGLNPLGIASEMVPFDIDPVRLDIEHENFATHSEQLSERAMKAMENAQTIFSHANDLKNRIRHTAVSTETFTQQVIEKDMEYRNKLIEIMGTPYEGTIGPGKTFPAGYKGPDYYFYNYVDVNEVSTKEPGNLKTYLETYFAKTSIDSYTINEGEDEGGEKYYKDSKIELSQFFKSDLSDSASTSDASTKYVVTYPVHTKDYAFQAPASWKIRKSPGEIQQSLIDLLLSETTLKLSIAEYKKLIENIQSKVDILKARDKLNDEELVIGTWAQENVKELNKKIRALKIASDAAEEASDLAWNMGIAASKALPTSVGMSTDPSGPGRAGFLYAGFTTQRVLSAATVGLDAAAYQLEDNKEDSEFYVDTNIQKARYQYDVQQQLREIEQVLSKEKGIRLEIFQSRENVRKMAEKYRSVLSKGLRLMEERKVYNAKVAAETQGKRYQDMTFRMNLNSALAKYRNAFDIAARYVYMAAKAYDYDTNLNERDPGSANIFLNQIIRQRLLGQNLDGEYVVGKGGLGDILAKLKINFNVLKTQMGLNNPQRETSRFSLRKELFRINKVADKNEQWRSKLKSFMVDDLWTIPEFRRFCRPFAERSAGKQPGIVIPFSTHILFGQNFFGWPLSGGDHAYDPTNYATKIRSVGLWFENYDNSSLAETPRLYIVPAGMDIMLVPNSTDLDHREWTIVDQRVPIPLPVGDSELNNLDWVPSLDGVNSSMTEIRKYSSFRAYHDSGYVTAGQISKDSRLIGRSVWNTRWVMIIPGGTFHYDAEFGLNKFIETVNDIKLFFDTYAISGN